MGAEMLRAICAVAEVPHPEDVGFDAVATLLRRDGAFLLAEDSLCVQFKARSESTSLSGISMAWSASGR